MVTLYQPTEYEQMLIAAGWVAVETVDPVYLEYLNRIPNRYDAMTHQQWHATLEELESLFAAYDAEIKPLLVWPGAYLTFEQQKRQRELLRQMDWCEAALGY